MKCMGFKIIGASFLAAMLSFAPFDKANALGGLQNSMHIGTGGTVGAFYNLVSVLDAAYSCSHANYGEGGTYMTSADRTGYGARSGYSANCAAGHSSRTASSVVTGSATMAAATAQTLGVISDRIAELKAISMAGDYDESLIKTAINEDLSKGLIGISSGDHMPMGIGVWAQGAFTKMKDSNVDTSFDGDVTSYMAGIDKSFNKGRFVVGLTYGYEKTELTTTFNAGTLDSSGRMLAPYISARLTDAISINLTGGQTKLSNDSTRTDTTGATVTGSFDSKRRFAAIKMAADHAKGKLKMSGNMGGTWSSEKADAFTESDDSAIDAATNTTAQGIIGGRIGYTLADSITPFVGATGEYAFKQTAVTVAASQTAPTQDKLGLRLNGGADIRIGKFISARVEGQSVLLKKNYKEHRGIVKLRVDF